jgi:multiple sugar transport system ATP-binding protein
VDCTAQSLDVADLLRRKPAAPSAGQRQRVALGRAIVREPQAFLFDEPLANLDVRLRRSTRALLRKLHQQLEATIIHVTHDQEEAMTLGDRVAVMNDGEILQIGTPLEVYRRPANRFVGSFLGSPPMNFVDGEVRGTAGEYVDLETPLGLIAIPRSRIEKDIPPPGTSITVGIRPEHVRINQGTRSAPTNHADEVVSSPIEMKITMIEPLGDRTHVHLTSKADMDLTATVATDTAPKPGQATAVTLDLDQCHIFSTQGDAARL